MGFNIAEAIQKASNLDVQGERTRLEYIDIGFIDGNDANFYELSDLDALANSIALDGLQQPLVVMQSPIYSNRYTLISGHRRRAAIERLVQDGQEPHPELRMVPCIRRNYESQAMAELQLILANSTARTLTSPEVMRQAERLEDLLRHLKEEEGVKFPGAMRDQVAQACQVSASRLARLKVIRENLIPNVLMQFERGDINESVAYEVAKLPVDVQEKLWLGSNLSKKTAEWVAKFGQRKPDDTPPQKTEAPSSTMIPPDAQREKVAWRTGLPPTNSFCIAKLSKLCEQSIGVYWHVAGERFLSIPEMEETNVFEYLTGWHPIPIFDPKKFGREIS